jgi:hypothetical protein
MIELEKEIKNYFNKLLGITNILNSWALRRFLGKNEFGNEVVFNSTL